MQKKLPLVLLLSERLSANRKKTVFFGDGAMRGKWKRIAAISSALFLLSFVPVPAASAEDPLLIPMYHLLLGKSGPTIQLVKDIFPGPDGSEPEELYNWNGLLFFEATDGVTGKEVWTSDGTESGTAILKDINPSGDSDCYTTMYTQCWNRSYTPLNGSLYFAATDSNDPAGLWKTDGTADGTSEVHSISPANLIVYNNELYFTGWDGIDSELWKSDGTNGGTVMVKNISEDYSSWAGDDGFIEFNTELYFRASNTNSNTSPESCFLWKTDGTEGGTVAVKPGTEIDPAGSFAVCNNALYFVADDATTRDIWKTDGTPENTVKVSTKNFSQTSRFIQYNGNLYITMDDGSTGSELWKIDCATDTVSSVKDIYPGSNSGNPQNFAVFGNSLYFRAGTADYGVELWKSDGTEAGTMMVKDIYPGTEGSYPQYLTVYNNMLYFSADDGVKGVELWESDGTEAGTRLVHDIYPGPEEGYPYELIPVNGTLFFGAADNGYDYELWKLKK